MKAQLNVGLQYIFNANYFHSHTYHEVCDESKCRVGNDPKWDQVSQHFWHKECWHSVETAGIFMSENKTCAYDYDSRQWWSSSVNNACCIDTCTSLRLGSINTVTLALGWCMGWGATVHKLSWGNFLLWLDYKRVVAIVAMWRAQCVHALSVHLTLR